ncbi:XRE family transcriptional regulator [Bifidobacterium goeldii]|uniref:XRE family transcriptional regulator n=1 Tax=Bifidobacterium goeldii TaxID=2306975 RepID=A0A430FEX6_9BIFI|nr:helix-turn-helix transcriptional regulator [Bifidobacterium goeldii]RSX51387.1 XRE family transcriptional regulator [Bifidobacterium goeldii]
MTDHDTATDWAKYSQELGFTLRRLRGARGFSQERVASDAGMSKVQYQRLEGLGGAPSNPTIKTLIAVAEVLDVSIGDLVPQPWPDLRAR